MIESFLFFLSVVGSFVVCLEVLRCVLLRSFI